MDSLYYRRRQQKRREFFVPFLMIVCLIVVIVLGIQLYTSFKTQEANAQRGRVFVSVGRGTGEFLAWGQDKWRNVYDGLAIVEGDTIKTGESGFITLTFFDGSRVRLNSMTEVVIEAVDVEKKHIYVNLRLVAGEIWINEVESDLDLQFEIFSPHLNARSIGTIYDITAAEAEEFVRTVRGEVKVLVANTLGEDEELLESVVLGIGQQMNLSAQDLEDLEARKFVNLLEPMDDYWRVTEWYTWNAAEDEKPAAVFEESSADAKNIEVNKDIPEENATDSRSEPVLPKIVVTSPEISPYTIDTDQIFLKGTVPPEVTKIVVTEFHKDPKGTPYPLQKFVPKSGAWNYAASEEYGNLKEGRNRFVFQAYTDGGAVSDPVEIVVIVERSETISPSADPDLSGEAASVSSSDETVESAVSSTLTMPALSSIEGAEKIEATRYKTSVERVVINGTVGDGASKVVVNGWPLSLYTPGSTSWTYYAKTEIGTLKAGTNTFTVFSEDAQGDRSATLTFTITKE